MTSSQAMSCSDASSTMNLAKFALISHGVELGEEGKNNIKTAINMYKSGQCKATSEIQSTLDTLAAQTPESIKKDAVSNKIKKGIEWDRKLLKGGIKRSMRDSIYAGEPAWAANKILKKVDSYRTNGCVKNDRQAMKLTQYEMEAMMWSSL